MVAKMTSELIQKVTKQIEYYFGDFNLLRDKFLRDLTGKEGGWIPITTLLTFKRLKSITEKESDIIEAFESSRSEIVELNETKDKLRRSKPLPDLEDEEFKKTCRLRTVHLRGFPKEETTLDELIEYCSQYGLVESVQMRRFEDKTFKGCVMVLYKDIESANRAISSNDKFKGEVDLILRENKETYLKRKKYSRKNDIKKKNKLVNLEVNGNNNGEEKDEKKEDDQKQEIEFKYENGCIIKLIDLPENVKFFEIKTELKKHSKVQYVDLFPETKTGIIRFASKEEKDKAVKALDYNENDTKKIDDENQEIDNKDTKIDEDQETDNKIEDAKINEKKEKAELTDKVENVNTNENQEDIKKDNQINHEQVSETIETVEKTTKNQKIKINDLILTYIVLEGDEEKDYWFKVKNLNLGSKESSNKGFKKHNSNNKRRFGGFKNNKRQATDDRNNSKKVKVDNEA